MKEILCKLIRNYFTLWPFKFIHHEIKFRETNNKSSDCEYKFRDATFKILYDTYCILNINAWKKLSDLNASIFKINYVTECFLLFYISSKETVQVFQKGLDPNLI